MNKREGNKREYNSERRRKHNDGYYNDDDEWIRENITPRGDGNGDILSL